MKTKYIIAIVIIFLLWILWRSKKTRANATGSKGQDEGGTGLFSWLPNIFTPLVTNPITGETIIPDGPLVHDFFTEEEKKEDSYVTPPSIVPPSNNDPVKPPDSPIFSTAKGESSSEKSGFSSSARFWKGK